MLNDNSTWEYWTADKWERLLNESKVKVDESTLQTIRWFILELKRDTLPQGWSRYTRAGELNVLYHKLGIL